MTFRQQCRLLGKTARRPVLSVPTNQPCGVGVKMPLDFSQDYSALCRTNQALPHPSRIRSDYCQSASPGQCRQRSLTVKRKLSLCLLLLFSFPKPTAEQDCLSGCGSSCQAEQRPSGTLMPRCTHSCQSLWVTGRVLSFPRQRLLHFEEEPWGEFLHPSRWTPVSATCSGVEQNFPMVGDVCPRPP